MATFIWERDRTSPFESSRDRLVDLLRNAAKRKQSQPSSHSPESSLDPTRIPQETFDEHEDLVEGLVLGDEAWTSLCSSTATAQQESPHRLFRKLILGKRVLQAQRPERARVLAILLQCNVDQHSTTWISFLRVLAPRDPPEPDTPLVDADLPLGIEQIKASLGDKLAADFQDEQYAYCEPITMHFPEVRQAFLEMLRGIYKTCAHETADIHAKDMFCPEDDLYQTLQDSESQILLEKLYVETKKWFTRFESQMERYRAVKLAQQKAPDFIRGVQPRQKILAALLQSDVQVQSQAWQRFMGICCPSTSSPSPLCDDALPLSGVDLRKYFGGDDNDPFLHNLDTWQYCFCAVKLQKHQQIEKSKKLHLPLLSSSLLGSGSVGEVSRVQVKGGYLFESDVTLAMKRMSMYHGDEWDKVSWLYEQKLEHQHIMKPIASIKMGDEIYLFYDEARYGDLEKYFTKHLQKGPGDHQEKMRLLDSMYWLAHAVEYLHCSVSRELEHKVRKMVCIHKDLKAQNILVTEEHEFKITDFGISSVILEGEPGQEGPVTPFSLSKRPTDTDLAQGVPHYPPEARKDGKVDCGGDVWSLGTVFAECLAWMSGGKSALDTLQRYLYSQGCKEYFDQHPDGTSSLKGIVHHFFEDTVQAAKDRGSDADARLYESCSRLLREKMLVCDPTQRSNIRAVVTCLRNMKDGLPVDHVFAGVPSVQKGSVRLEQRSSDDPIDTPTSKDQQDRQSTSEPREIQVDRVNDLQPSASSQHVPNSMPQADQRQAPIKSITGSRGQARPDPVRLLEAAEQGNRSEVQRLLDAGVDVSAKDKDGWTALHYAVFQQHGNVDTKDPEITRLLLGAKPSLVHEENSDGETAMHKSVECGSLQHARELWVCTEKPDLHAKNRYGDTVFSFAKSKAMRDWLAERQKEEDGQARHVERA